MFAHQLRTRPAFQRFLRNREGNVAILFALMLTPLLATIGVAVDYSRAGNAQSVLQGAADTTALAVSVDAGDLDEDALSARASEVMRANYPAVSGASIVNVGVVRTEEDITVTAEASVPTSFAAIMGVENIPVRATSSTVWGKNPVELALVLDNTGSMDDFNKLETLQDAVHDMLDILESKSEEEEGSVRVSIIPFATQVRLDVNTYKNKSWLSGAASSGPPTTGGFSAWLAWYLAGGYNQPQWTGCISDRTQPYDVSDAAYSSATSATSYPASSCKSSQLEEILPMTDDFDKMRDKIDDMHAQGNTNVTIGVAWGMAALSHQEPLTEASAPGEIDGLKRVMVVLTDGLNTENRWTGNTGDIDARTALACTNAKAADVEIYTVRVIEGNETLLRNCATDSSHYFDVENVSDLLPVFQMIGTRISELRIAR